MGSLERCMYLVLENTVYQEQEGKAPMLPLWLSPEQIRIVPVSDEFTDEAIKLSESLESGRIRVGVDDRSLPLSRKIFDAKSKWVPYIIVLGEKESKTKKYAVTIREESSSKIDKKQEMTKEEIIAQFQKKMANLPFRPMYSSKLLSKRIIFVSWSQEKK
jgi:threonyl-tRNA synthetase